MWKLLSSYNRKSSCEISPPTLVGTTYDAQILDEPGDLTALPAVQSRSTIRSREHEEDQISGASDQADDNRTLQTHKKSERPILMTDDGGEAPRKRSFASHIPRLGGKKLNRSASATTKPAQTTRWDEFLGEPTTASTGKPGQVKPSAFVDPFGEPADPRLGNETSISGPTPKRSGFAQKAAKMGRDALTLETRVPWKASNARASSVEPVGNTAKQHDAIRKTPQRGSLNNSGSEVSLGLERGVSPVADSDSIDEDAIVSPLSITKRLPPRASPPASPASLVSASRSQHEAYPTPVSARATSPSSGAKIKRKPVSSIVTSGDTGTPAQSTKAEQSKSHFSWTMYAQSTQDDKSIKTTETSQADSSRDNENQGSRLSWLTVNTTTTHQQDSPPPSPPPALVAPIASIMSRSRPVPPADKEIPPTPPSANTHIKLFDSTYAFLNATPLQVKKASVGQLSTPGQANSLPGRANAMQTPKQLPTPTSIKTSTGKALPPPPSFSPKMSHVEALTARRDDLALQHQNLRRLVTDVQKVDQASPLVVDEKSRRQNKKTLDEYTARLEEVEKEEHDVGRALTRARRKVEREEGIDSGLWVRRVTR